MLDTEGKNSNGIITLMNLYTNVQELSTEPHTGSFGQDEAGGEFIFIADSILRLK